MPKLRVFAAGALLAFSLSLSSCVVFTSGPRRNPSSGFNRVERNAPERGRSVSPAKKAPTPATNAPARNGSGR
jgi:hypothetical protein